MLNKDWSYNSHEMIKYVNLFSKSHDIRKITKE